ncbi:NUDIX domain-containing protein [Candidatus Roizmanbacteria bacterium]|nr:NUDIX domain-containing protein [Candidatus Roizmanbacteria bacterium]
MNENQLFYAAQKAFIEKKGEILILHDPLIGLDFPGGRIQVGETNLITALQREVREETTLEIQVGNPFTTWIFKHPTTIEQSFLTGYRCTYVSGEVSLSDEHDNFHWVNKDNYTQFKDSTDYYKALEHYFQLFA